MSSGDKNQIRGLDGDSISREWVDPRPQTSRQKLVDEDKLVRLHEDSSKILGLLGLKSSIIPFPETGTNLDVLHEELEQIQVEIFKLQAAQGVVTKLLQADAIKGISKDLAEEDWVILNDTEVTGEAATAGESQPPEQCCKEVDREEVVTLNTGDVQSSEVDDSTKEEEEEDEEDIGALTTAEDDQRILYQHSVLQKMISLEQGKSLEGKTLPELSNGIPTNTSLVISVSNYMDVALEEPAIFYEDYISILGRPLIEKLIRNLPSSAEVAESAGNLATGTSMAGQAENVVTSPSMTGQTWNLAADASISEQVPNVSPGALKPELAENAVTDANVAKLAQRLPTSLLHSLKKLSKMNHAGISVTVGSLTEVQTRTTEVVRVKPRTPTLRKLSGILGYKIPKTDRKLFINFEVHQRGETHIGLSLGPDHLAVGEDARCYIWYETNYNTFRPDTRRNGKQGLAGQLVVSNENLCAWGEISGGAKATLKVAIWSQDAANRLVRSLKPKLDDAARFIGPVPKPFACKLILDNLLKVELFQSDLMLQSGMTQGDISSVLRPSKTESLLVSGSKSAEGLVFYKIGRTDIRLAIAFWVLPAHSLFAISFVGPESVCNDELLKSMSTNLKNWTRSSFKLASPSDGEQQIQIRNLVAKAVMSNVHGASKYSCHSLLKVSIQVQKSPLTEYCSEKLD